MFKADPEIQFNARPANIAELDCRTVSSWPAKLSTGRPKWSKTPEAVKAGWYDVEKSFSILLI